MHRFFFYGTLCHPPLLGLVLGREIALQPARLPGHAVFWAEGEAFPLLLPEAGGLAEGVIAEGLDAEDLARLDYYEGGFAYVTHDVDVEGAAGPVTAKVYFAEAGVWRPGAPWRLADWQARWADPVVAAAQDFMAEYGRRPAREVLGRYPMLLARAASRLRAVAETAPTTLRHAADPDDIAILDRQVPYARFFSVEDLKLRHRLFGGGMSPVLDRAVFVSGDAATVLPYDPVRDRVLLIEQLRPGPIGRGDPEPWSLEAIAGRIDAGETPEETVLREAVEEAGLAIGALHRIGGYYASPGAKTEFVYSYVGIADLPDGLAGGGGLETEGEDIRTHVVPFERLMALVATGEAGNAPLILSALWLQRERPRLQAEAAGN